MDEFKYDIVNVVKYDLSGRNKRVKSKLYEKIKECIEKEYKEYGIFGITVSRFLEDFNPENFGEESFTLGYFDELVE